MSGVSRFAETRDIGGCPVAADAGDIDGRSDERPSGADDKPPGATNARETGAGAHAGKGNEDSYHYE
jgi:hypothetical protein